MGGFDRSKFGATSVKTLKKQEEAHAELRPSNQNGSGRADYHKLDNGKNTFRILPFHPDGDGDSFAEAKTVSFLEVTVPKRDDAGRVVDGEEELKRYPIFNARVHGVDINGECLGIDLVETYLGLLKGQLEEEYEDDKEGFKKQWAKATGFKSKDSLKPQDSWMMYALKWIVDASDEEGGHWKFGMLEVKSSIRTQLNEIAAELEDAGDVLEMDPFSDPDSGFAIEIVKDDKAEPSKYYKVNFKSIKKKTAKGFSTEMMPVKLSDAQLTELSDKKSLNEMLRNQYTESTFLQQVEGLTSFDSKYKFGVTELEDWEVAVAFLEESVLPDPKEGEKEEEEEEEAPKPKAKPKMKAKIKAKEMVEEEESEEVEDDSDAVVISEEIVEDEAEEIPEGTKNKLADLRKRLGK
jgi:hypothetical protein